MIDTIAAMDHKLTRYRHDADLQRALAVRRTHLRRRLAAGLRAVARHLDADLAPAAPPRFG